MPDDETKLLSGLSGMKINDNYLYVTAGFNDRGLSIIDISDPTHLKYVYSMDILGAQGVDVVGDFVYVIYENTLGILTTNPEILPTVDTTNQDSTNTINLPSTLDDTLSTTGPQFDVDYLYRVDDGYNHDEFSSNNPIDVDLRDGRIYLGDKERHRIEIFSNDWTSVHMFGGEGHGNGQFAEILDIAIKQNKIYVLDKISDWGTPYTRVQAFEKTGKFLYSFELRGTLDQKPDYFTMIAVDDKGRIYLGDFSQIKKYSSRGVLDYAIGVVPYDGVKFDLISDIKTHNDNLYVIDSDTDKVHVFSSSGEHLRSFGESKDFGTSVHMAVDRYGRILVTAYSSGEILLYSVDGVLLKKFSNDDFGLDNYAPTQVIAYRNNIYVIDNNTSSLHAYFIYKSQGNDDSLGIADFVDSKKNPRHYVDRYNNEAAYKQWFDDQYSAYFSINQAVGLSKIISPCQVGTDLESDVCTIMLNDNRKPSHSSIPDDKLNLSIFSYSFRILFPLIVSAELLISLAVFSMTPMRHSKTLSTSILSNLILSVLPFTSFYAFDRIGRFRDAILLIIPIKAMFILVIIVSWDFMIPYVVYFVLTLVLIAYFMKKFSKEPTPILNKSAL